MGNCKARKGDLDITKQLFIVIVALHNGGSLGYVSKDFFLLSQATTHVLGHFSVGRVIEL